MFIQLYHPQLNTVLYGFFSSLGSVLKTPTSAVL